MKMSEEVCKGLPNSYIKFEDDWSMNLEVTTFSTRKFQEARINPRACASSVQQNFTTIEMSIRENSTESASALVLLKMRFKKIFGDL